MIIKIKIGIIPFGLAFYQKILSFPQTIHLLFCVRINIKPSARVIWKCATSFILLILIPLTGKIISRKGLNLTRMWDIDAIISRKGFNINRMVALYHYGRGTSVVCTEAQHLTAAKWRNYSWCHIVLPIYISTRRKGIIAKNLTTNSLI